MGRRVMITQWWMSRMRSVCLNIFCLLVDVVIVVVCRGIDAVPFLKTTIFLQLKSSIEETHFCAVILLQGTESLSLHQDPASPRGTPLPSPRENGLDKARLLKKDPCSPASTASSASSSSLKSKEMSMVGIDSCFCCFSIQMDRPLIVNICQQLHISCTFLRDLSLCVAAR